MPLRPRPEIEKLAPSPHGSVDYAELKTLGLTPENVIDFSVCSNPYMLPPDLSNMCDAAALSRLPDSQATEFRECLAGKLGVSPANLLAGNGSTELIHLVALTYFGNGDSVLILEPTFGEYAVACQISGATVMRQWAGKETKFAHRIEETIDLIKRVRPKGIFICNPNNPTGRYLSRREIESVLDASPDSLLVLDEAYVGFVEKKWSSLDLISRDNLVITRSMTKDYALGGLRLGYAVAHRQIIETLRRVAQPWNVNIVAQRAGVVVLDETGALERSQQQIREAKQFLVRELTRLGFTPLPSETHYFLVKVANPKEFRTVLLRQGLLIRDCASFGLPEYVRIAARTMPENERLIATIKKIRKEK
ncbi:MAG: histidinol-phosphate aminotransferase family protein [Chloroflexi bacterium]|nr:histidinol-phosphate aminotransferase family protein [Chloroflexota bacterium]